MVYASLLTSILLATAAFAAPSSDLEPRRRRSRPLRRVETKASSDFSNVQYSSDLSGAIWETYPAGSFKAVTGTFVVPTLSTPGSASAWVGIDGGTCSNAILQTGIDFTNTNGVVSYDAWYEWYPAFAFNFNGITITAGDTVKLTVTATSTTTGTVVVQNLTNGQTVSQSLSSSSALCEENVEWIVEEYSLTDFGTVAFTNSYATLTTGGTISPNGATIVEIQGVTCVTENPTGVTITYSKTCVA